MKLAIIGSRNLNIDLEKYMDRFENLEMIISGGAKGIDTCAEEYAKRHNIPTMIFLPEYNIYGKNAPLIRNIDIIKNCDEVLAFWDGYSKGTTFTIQKAKKAGKPVHLFTKSFTK